MVRNTVYQHNSSTSSSTTSNTVEDITSTQSYEATHRILVNITEQPVIAAAATEDLNNKPTGSTASTAAAFLPTSVVHHNRPPAPATTVRMSRSNLPPSRPTSIPNRPQSYDHADEQLCADAHHKLFLHRLREGHRRVEAAAVAAAAAAADAKGAPQQQQQQQQLSTSIVAREYHRLRVERNECIVGSPEVKLPLLEPGVLKACIGHDFLPLPGSGNKAKSAAGPSASSSSSSSTAPPPLALNTDAISLGRGVQSGLLDEEDNELDDSEEDDEDDEDSASVNSQSSANDNMVNHDDDDNDYYGIFPMEMEMDTDSADHQQYQVIFTSLQNVPQLVDTTVEEEEDEEEEEEEGGDEVDSGRFVSEHNQTQHLTTEPSSSSSSSPLSRAGEERPSQRLAAIRQVAIELRQISADFAATRRGSAAAAAAAAAVVDDPPSFSQQCANLLVHLILQTFALPPLDWLLNWR